jgi:hypothetical protein
MAIGLFVLRVPGFELPRSSLPPSLYIKASAVERFKHKKSQRLPDLLLQTLPNTSSAFRHCIGGISKLTRPNTDFRAITASDTLIFQHRSLFEPNMTMETSGEAPKGPAQDPRRQDETSTNACEVRTTPYRHSHEDPLRWDPATATLQETRPPQGEPAHQLLHHGPHCTPSQAPQLDCCPKCDQRERYCSCEGLPHDDEVSETANRQAYFRQRSPALEAHDVMRTPGQDGPRTPDNNEHDEGKSPLPQTPSAVHTGASNTRDTLSGRRDARDYSGPVVVTLPLSPPYSPSSTHTASSSSTYGPGTPVQIDRDSLFIQIDVPSLGILPAGVPLEDSVTARLSLASTSSDGPGTPVGSLADSLFLDGDVFSMRLFPEGVSPEDNVLCAVRGLSCSSGIDSLGNTRVANPDDALRHSLALLLEMWKQTVHIVPGTPGRILLLYRCRDSAVRFWNGLKERMREWLLQVRRMRQIHG